MQEQFLHAFSHLGAEITDRFADFFATLKSNQITSAQEVMEWFADRDTKRITWRKRLIAACRIILLIPIGASVGAAIKPPYHWPTFVLWAVTALAAPFGIWAAVFAKDPGQPFTRRDVEDYFASEQNPPAPR